MIDDIRTRALDPMIQSAVGIVRESAGLIYHIAGFGIALLSGPEDSQPKYGNRRTRPVTPEGANVIAFPSSKCKAAGPCSTRNRS
jgi:hypothetical protein